MLAISRLEDDLRFQIIEDLVVSEVTVSWKYEELILCTNAFQRENDDSLLNHVELREGISILNDFITWQVDPAIQVAQEVTDELSTSIKPKLIIIKHVFKVLVEAMEQLFNKLIPNLRLELVKELLSPNKVVVEVE